MTYMNYTNKRIELIAIDQAAYNVAFISYLMNGYEYISGTGESVVDSYNIAWYRCILIRKEDMMYKIFGV